MSERETDNTDLFDSADSELKSDDLLDIDEQDTDSEDDQGDDVELKPKKLSAEEQRKKQVDVWTQRVVDGEVDIDDLPPNLKWLKNPIKRNLDAISKVPDIDEVVEKKIAEREAEKEFQRLKASLKDLEMTSSQRKQLQEEFSELTGAGLLKDKALAKALKIVGAKEEDINLDRRMAAVLPKPGNQSSKNEIELTLDNYNDIPSDKRVEHYEKLRRRNNNSNMNV